MNKSFFQKTSIALGLSVCSFCAIAETPWTLERGQYSITTTQVNEHFTDKWLGKEKSYIPEISQKTLWLSGSYGITDRLQISAITGHTSSEWEASDYDYSGRADSSIGLKYRALNQYEDDAVTLAFHIAATIAGSYERAAGGRPHSPGDKADSIELIIPFSRSFSHFVLLAELGYRARSDDVPDEMLASVGSGLTLGPIYLQALYRSENSRSGLDIAQAPFTPDRFHETEEDRTLFDFSITGTFLRNWSVYGGHANVLTGRNTGDSSIYYLGLSYRR